MQGDAAERAHKTLALGKGGSEIHANFFGNRHPGAGPISMRVPLIIDAPDVGVIGVHAHAVVKGVAERNPGADRSRGILTSAEIHLVIADAKTWDDVDVIAHKTNRIANPSAETP